MNHNYRDIIKAPIVSEKAAQLKQANQYAFSVDLKANKFQVKEAIEKIFDVKVTDVKIINVKPKTKRVGRYYGTRNKVKKAIVTLNKGNTIEI